MNTKRFTFFNLTFLLLLLTDFIAYSVHFAETF